MVFHVLALKARKGVKNETNQKILQFDIKLTSNYPAINERTEVSNANVIDSAKFDVNLLEGNN